MNFAERYAAVKLASKMLDSVPGLRTPIECPVEGCDWDIIGTTYTLNVGIIHLNDDHRWSREQIADWLDGLDIDLTFQVPSDL